jgi:hypothetical protein
MFAKRQGITAEEMTERQIDACVDGGDVRSFQMYRAKYGHYPDHTQLNDAASLFREDWEKTWKANKSRCWRCLIRTTRTVHSGAMSAKDFADLLDQHGIEFFCKIF